MFFTITTRNQLKLGPQALDDAQADTITTEPLGLPFLQNRKVGRDCRKTSYYGHPKTLPLRLFTKFFSPQRALIEDARAEFSAEPLPENPLYVIGDIHGRDDLLTKILEQIDDHMESKNTTQPHLVFVGDYIDRGENSREVLSLVFDLCQKLPHTVTALLGNHEKMMLDFLDRPETRGDRWLRNGGLQTLASFGIGGVSDASGKTELIKARDKLDYALSYELKNWLRNLPLQSNSGNVHVVHAAADPTLPMSKQQEQTLLWGKSSFHQLSRDDGNWVVHGHTISEKPGARDGRISLDTGAYYSGQLTAVYICGGDIHFLST